MSVIDDMTWISLSAWFFLLALGYTQEIEESKIMGCISGLIMGLLLLLDSPIFGFLIIIVNIVLLVRETGRH